ncbi:MAG: adenylate/guanylate cyclase domain-containing protein, partial [Chloroflexota bacterium]
EMVAATPALPPSWHVRVGVHVGPVIAGVIGRRQYLFDVWGDTVNTAARVESLGAPNAVNVSAAAWHHISHLCHSEAYGRVYVKGKGEMEMYRVDKLIED